MSVFVINQRNQPLMPTSPRKSKLLLKQNKAKVVNSKPFTIKLLYATGETKQQLKYLTIFSTQKQRQKVARSF